MEIRVLIERANMHFHARSPSSLFLSSFLLLLLTSVQLILTSAMRPAPSSSSSSLPSSNPASAQVSTPAHLFVLRAKEKQGFYLASHLDPALAFKDLW